jgi:hypothetical protein
MKLLTAFCTRAGAATPGHPFIRPARSAHIDLIRAGLASATATPVHRGEADPGWLA